MSIASTEVTVTKVKMAGIDFAKAPGSMETLLGSCIGVAIWDRMTKQGGLAHVVLPESAGRGGTPGKFADIAVPQMLEILRKQGLPTYGLTAKLAGGANMFNGSGPLQIGNANAVAVAAALKKAGIRVAGQDVGGTHGRRITFDCASGEMTVQCPGQPTRTL